MQVRQTPEIATSRDARGALPSWVPWLGILLALMVLYLPGYRALAETFWSRTENAEGPIILGVCLWLVWRERGIFVEPHDPAMHPLGIALFAFGLIVYALGRSQEFFQFEIGSQIPVLLGLVIVLLGRGGVRRLWFPIFFLVFLVPIPGSVLDSLLLPLKQSVSTIVDEILHFVGYPISRNGVVLVIGAYQLMIADACSGLNSMIALSGIGLLYVYLVGHTNRLVTAALLLSIFPVAFLANIFRVIVLVLATYHFGDQAGQTFHDYAGYIEIVVAFGGFFLVDALLVALANRVLANPNPVRDS